MTQDDNKNTVLIWHPNVHEHFSERLYFFLLALKPYKEAAFRDKLRELLREFGVPVNHDSGGYCSYEVLGDFDHLLRIWLPIGSEPEFINKARATLPNLRAILTFSVYSFKHDWRFTGSPSKQSLHLLTSEKIRSCQLSRTKSECGDFVNENIAALVTRLDGAHLRRHPNRIKAFMSLQAPGNADDSQKDFIESELISLIQNSKGIDSCTFHGGVGFTWLIVKLVAHSFSSLAALVTKIGTQYGGFGISTSTYVAIRTLSEGDAIGEKGLALDKAVPKEIKEFLPAIESAIYLSEPGRKQLLRFVQDNVITKQFNDPDRKAIQDFLAGFLNNDEASAAAALYKPIVQTERNLRELVKEVAGRAHNGDPAGYFKKHNFDFKTLETIPFSTSLKAGCQLADEILPDWQKCPELENATLDQLAQTRNKLMHGAALDLQANWENLARQLILLITVRDHLTSSLERCREKLSK